MSALTKIIDYCLSKIEFFHIYLNAKELFCRTLVIFITLQMELAMIITLSQSLTINPCFRHTA